LGEYLTQSEFEKLYGVKLAEQLPSEFTITGFTTKGSQIQSAQIGRPDLKTTSAEEAFRISKEGVLGGQYYEDWLHVHNMAGADYAWTPGDVLSIASIAMIPVGAAVIGGEAVGIGTRVATGALGGATMSGAVTALSGGSVQQTLVSAGIGAAVGAGMSAGIAGLQTGLERLGIGVHGEVTTMGTPTETMIGEVSDEGKISGMRVTEITPETESTSKGYADFIKEFLEHTYPEEWRGAGTQIGFKTIGGGEEHYMLPEQFEFGGGDEFPYRPAEPYLATARGGAGKVGLISSGKPSDFMAGDIGGPIMEKYTGVGDIITEKGGTEYLKSIVAAEALGEAPPETPPQQVWAERVVTTSEITGQVDPEYLQKLVEKIGIATQAAGAARAPLELEELGRADYGINITEEGKFSTAFIDAKLVSDVEDINIGNIASGLTPSRTVGPSIDLGKITDVGTVPTKELSLDVGSVIGTLVGPKAAQFQAPSVDTSLRTDLEQTPKQMQDLVQTTKMTLTSPSLGAPLMPTIDLGSGIVRRGIGKGKKGAWFLKIQPIAELDLGLSKAKSKRNPKRSKKR
jgi:hypothetical protein